MSELRKIGKHDVSKCIGFHYDGCHKIYLLENQSEAAEATADGYATILPMSELERTFSGSCPLRFINWWNLQKPSVVPQCAIKVVFKYDDHLSVVKFNTK